MITKEQLDSWYEHKSNKEHTIEQEMKLREAFLETYNCTEDDVMEDEDGMQYIMIQNESDHSDGYQVDYKRIDLPL